MANLLPTATAEELGPAKVTAKVTVELVEGGDQEVRRKKEEEAESTQRQNALPSRIEYSSLMGNSTAAGPAQQAKSSGHNADKSSRYEQNGGLSSPEIGSDRTR